MNTTPNCAPKPEEAKSFLRFLDKTTDAFTFFVIGPDGAKSATILRLYEGTLAEHWPTMVPHNTGNPPCGGFVTVHQMDGRGRKTVNVVRRRAVFAELDNGLPDRPWPFDPSMLVESSLNKYHAWFLCEGLTSEEFRGVQRRMVLDWGSDRGVIDEARSLEAARTPSPKGLGQPAPSSAGIGNRQGLHEGRDS